MWSGSFFTRLYTLTVFMKYTHTMEIKLQRTSNGEKFACMNHYIFTMHWTLSSHDARLFVIADSTVYEHDELTSDIYIAEHEDETYFRMPRASKVNSIVH